MNSIRNFLLAAFIALFSIPVSTQPESNEKLILAVHPYLPYKELQKRFKPLADYLAARSGQSIIVRIGADYKEHIENIGQEKVDIAFMGPASYVKLVRIYGKKHLLGKFEMQGKSYFKGKIIVRHDSKIKSLKDLKGKLFAYGDPDSTMSHLVPRYMIHRAGVSDKDLRRFEFLGSHDNVALGVLSGDFDAGAVKDEIFYKYQKQGLKELAATPEIPDHVFVARNSLPAALVKKIRSALFSMSGNLEGRRILSAIRNDVTGIVPVQDSDYQKLRLILNELAKSGIK